MIQFDYVLTGWFNSHLVKVASGHQGAFFPQLFLGSDTKTGRIGSQEVLNDDDLGPPCIEKRWWIFKMCATLCFT